MKRLIAITVLLLAGIATSAQEKGFIRGNIADGDFGGPMIGATITIAEKPGFGTTTDFDGNYSLTIEPGTYTVQIAFISYTTQVFSEVEVKAGEPTIIDGVLATNVNELAAVEITAEIRRNSEVALLMDMKNASGVTDGLSAQSFRKLGDSDLSGAIKRVTGVTVQNGKYVYVRGLGDRYTKTTLNGMGLPGLDPDVNAVQIDIFPTNVLENVSVAKSFTPDLDGDFTGGLVNVVTKQFPDQKTTQFSIGAAFIPTQHFNSDYILYERNPLDFTGFDFGTRELPFPATTQIPNPVLNDPEQENITKSFDPVLATSSAFAAPNMSASINHGNQINKENGATLGYNLVYNYSSETAFYEDFQSNDYLKDNIRENNDLVRQVTRKGDVGKRTVLWSALASGSYKKNKNTLSITLMGSQSGETMAAKRINRDVEQNQAELSEDVLGYSQRSLASGIIAGEHQIGKATLNWANAVSASRVYDPDFRESKISITEGDTTLSTGNGAGLFRFWRDLVEFNESFKADLKLPYGKKGTFFKAGVAGTIKARTFETVSFKHTRRNLSDVSIDPNWYLQEDNIWTADIEDPNNQNGTYTIGTFQPANSFDARQNIFAGYLMSQNQITDALRVTFGARVEQTNMFYTGEDNSGIEEYNDFETLDQLNVLPSFNAVYALSDKTNLRGGASRTLARPSFKEKSIAQIYDPITKRTFNGNLDLDITNINNYDLRYEHFMSGRELFAVGVFYKQFDGHIELVSFSDAPDNLKPRNSGNAESYGVEVELRKGLPESESWLLRSLFLSTNFSLVNSRVDLNSVFVDNFGQTEFELRENNLRDGESLSRYRQMAGQSPYAINVAISYQDVEDRNNISLAYNVQGEQLTIIASGRVPDIYTVPFHSLNLNAYRNFGNELRSRVTFGVSNILDEDRTLVYRSYEADEAIYTTYKPGVAISLKYGYTF